MRKISIVILGFLTIISGACVSQTEQEKEGISINMHDHHTAVQVTADKDIPVFRPSVQTYSNSFKVVDAENIYVRYNTSMANRDTVINFFNRMLQEEGWLLNQEKSTAEKFIISKEGRYATIRIFDMKEGDSTLLAFSINLVKPVFVTKHSAHSMAGMDMHRMH